MDKGKTQEKYNVRRSEKKIENVAELKEIGTNLTNSTTYTGFMGELAYFSIGLASLFIFFLKSLTEHLLSSK